MLILADVGNVAGAARERLTRWIDEGGVLVRFAGPRLAASDDDLVPVKLRRGGRTLGGSLSWDKPQPLASFSREGPFNAMPVPGDVTVNRQVLAEPEAGISERTWAALADGTPLVTGAQARQGPGRAVSCHRRYALVGSAAVRRVRRYAEARGRARRNRRQCRTRRAPSACAKRSRPRACSTASAPSPRRRPRPGRCRPITVRVRPPIIRPDFTGRRKDSSP